MLPEDFTYTVPSLLHSMSTKKHKLKPVCTNHLQSDSGHITTHRNMNMIKALHEADILLLPIFNLNILT